VSFGSPEWLSPHKPEPGKTDDRIVDGVRERVVLRPRMLAGIALGVR